MKGDQAMSFTKRFVMIVGRAIPGIQLSPAESQEVTLPSGRTIMAQFADVLTLRETNPANGPVTTYLTVTRENLRFTALRFSNVANLDFDPETGALLTIEELEARRMADIAERQLANAARTATVSIDLDAAE